MAMQTEVLGRHFLKNEPSETFTSRKTTDSIGCQRQHSTFPAKIGKVRTSKN